jgi:hypothetical protein
VSAAEGGRSEAVHAAPRPQKTGACVPAHVLLRPTLWRYDPSIDVQCACNIHGRLGSEAAFFERANIMNKKLGQSERIR